MTSNYFRKLAPGVLWITLAVSWTPSVSAQQTISSVRISTEPAGPQFNVDGSVYQGAATLLWPSGSKHFLDSQPTQTGVRLNTMYVLDHWATNLSDPQRSVSPITADPGLTWVKAVYKAYYKLMLRVSSCAPGTQGCLSPGKVYVNDVGPYLQDEDIWIEAGKEMKVEAYPGDGFVFTGWSIGPNPGIAGASAFIYRFVMNQPYSLQPKFQPARPVSVSIDTSPSGLQILVDRSPLVSPVSQEWGFNTVHALGVQQVQVDAHGRYWIFDSWSDKGAMNHNFQIPAGATQVSVVARFVPAQMITFLTDPPALKLTIDGRDNWPAYTFNWAAGSTHTVSAPAEQADAEGRLYRFVSWSNGASASQDFVVQSLQSGQRITAAYEPFSRMTLASDPAGLTIKVDGQDCHAPCTIDRAVGAAVKIAAPGSVATGDASRLDFAGWSDGGEGSRTVTAPAKPVTLTAAYRGMNRLSAAADPADAAVWRFNPASPDGFYETGSQVAVSVESQPGFRFRQWGGDASGTRASLTLDLSSPRGIRALFDRVPYLTPGVRNAAGETPIEAVAPGSAATVYGLNLADETRVGPDSPLVQTLAGVTVRVGDRLLPLYFVSPGQINFQVPSDLSEGEQTLTVSRSGQPDVTAKFTVARNAPGLFAWASSDVVFAVALHADGSLVTPDAPAARGELLTLLGTGFGGFARTPPDGFAVPPDSSFPISDPVRVTVAGSEQEVVSCGAAAGRVGLVSVTFRLSGDVGSGNSEVRVEVNGVESNAAKVAVE